MTDTANNEKSSSITIEALLPEGVDAGKLHPRLVRALWRATALLQLLKEKADGGAAIDRHTTNDAAGIPAIIDEFKKEVGVQSTQEIARPAGIKTKISSIAEVNNISDDALDKKMSDIGAPRIDIKELLGENAGESPLDGTVIAAFRKATALMQLLEENREKAGLSDGYLDQLIDGFGRTYDLEVINDTIRQHAKPGNGIKEKALEERTSKIVFPITADNLRPESTTMSQLALGTGKVLQRAAAALQIAQEKGIDNTDLDESITSIKSSSQAADVELHIKAMMKYLDISATEIETRAGFSRISKKENNPYGVCSPITIKDLLPEALKNDGNRSRVNSKTLDLLQQAAVVLQIAQKKGVPGKTLDQEITLIKNCKNPAQIAALIPVICTKHNISPPDIATALTSSPIPPSKPASPIPLGDCGTVTFRL